MSELSPEEKVEVFARFEQALVDWLTTVNPRGISIHDIFYAGYKAGYGHAKDDAQEAMENR